MIEYLKGNVAELTPTYAVIDVAGVGYEVNITLNSYEQLQGKEQCLVLVHEIIRDDAHLLFGFVTRQERDLFRLLISVSGVGANTARLILSSVPPAELVQVIARGQEQRLKSVKGVGAKTAQRIIVDLRDKIKGGDDTLISQPTYRADIYDETLAALVMLGFAKPASQKVLQRLFAESPSLTAEQAIKKALTMF